MHYSKNMNPGFREYLGGWISSSENYFKFFLLIIFWDLELFWDAKNFLVCFREFQEVCVIRYCLIIHVFDEEIQYILWQPSHLVFWGNDTVAAVPDTIGVSSTFLASFQELFGMLSRISENFRIFQEVQEWFVVWYYEIIHVVIETIKYILWQPWRLVVWDNNWSNISLASMQFSFGF